MKWFLDAPSRLALWSLACSSVVVSVGSTASTASSSTTTNDLNKVLSFLLEEMKTDGFFTTTWGTYFGGTPAMPECSKEAVVEAVQVPAIDADESLKNVLDSSIIKIGVSPVAADIPTLYSTTTATTGEGGGGQPYSTDLTDNIDELDGYYPALMKEAVRRIGELYETTISIEIVLVTGETFFESIVDALNNDTVDVAWTAIGVREDRAAQVDFTCPDYRGDLMIAASAVVGGDLPEPASDGSSNNISVACITFYCQMTVPPPFVLVNLGDDASASDLNNALINTTDPYEYTMGTASTLEYFFKENCPGCSILPTDPLFTGFAAPATKKKVHPAEADPAENAPPPAEGIPAGDAPAGGAEDIYGSTGDESNTSAAGCNMASTSGLLAFIFAAACLL